MTTSILNLMSSHPMPADAIRAATLDVRAAAMALARADVVRWVDEAMPRVEVAVAAAAERGRSASELALTSERARTLVSQVGMLYRYLRDVVDIGCSPLTPAARTLLDRALPEGVHGLDPHTAPTDLVVRVQLLVRTLRRVDAAPLVDALGIRAHVDALEDAAVALDQAGRPATVDPARVETLRRDAQDELLRVVARIARGPSDRTRSALLAPYLEAVTRAGRRRTPAPPHRAHA